MSSPKEIPATFFVAGGALRPDAPSYVERLADRQLREIASSGELCYVLTTRQMGKSSLMVRTVAYLRQQNIQTAIIDLTSIGRAAIDEWFLSLMDDLELQLSLATDAEEWWYEHQHLSQIKRFTKFIQEVVANEVNGRVAIFIDEIDSMLNLAFADDFFAAIRAIYNRSTLLPADHQVSFVLLGVAAPNDLIKDATRTPFNVGRRIKLEELAIEDAHVLLYGLPGESLSVLERIFYWTNGHPYLTQRVGLSIAREANQDWTDTAVDELVERLFLTDEALNQESNLQFVRSRIMASPNKNELIKLYRRVCDGQNIRSSEQSGYQNELKLYGLLRVDAQKNLAIRNRIYRRVFDQEWIGENLPSRRGRFIALAAAAVIILALLLGIFVVRQNQQAMEPDEVLAQTYIEEFEGTNNVTLRLNSLSRLFELGGYDERAAALFHSLTPVEQAALFQGHSAPPVETTETSTAASLIPQMRRVIHGTYSSLYTLDLQNAADTTDVLAAMVEALAAADDRQSEALRNEISIWLAGRKYAHAENYASAKTAYDIAINFNPNNPSTYFERALAAVQLADYGSAVSDLAFVLEQWPEWGERVRHEIEKHDVMRDYIVAMDVPPSFIDLVPSPTASPTKSLTEQTTVPVTVTSTPAPLPAAERTISTVTPTPFQNPLLVELGRSGQGKPIQAVRFGSGERVVVFVGGLLAGQSPGTVDLAQRAVLYFTENLEAVPDSVTLFIVTNANPDSPLDPGSLAGRLNANGVDLNRNWDCRWQENPRIGQEIVAGAGGSAPFSEPETQALRDFFLEQQPVAVVFWFARAESGIVIAGGCQRDPLISDELGGIYSAASRYTSYAENEYDYVPGDATNWLTDQNTAAIAVLLPEYERTDWNNNLLGMLAVLESYQ